LVAKGTQADPIVFTSSGSKKPGAWQGIHLYGESKGSTLDFVTIEFAGGKDQPSLFLDNAKEVTITNSTFKDSLGTAIRSYDTTTFAAPMAGNTFAKQGRGAFLGPCKYLANFGANTYNDAVPEL